MRSLFIIDDNPENKISYYLIMLMLVALPFDQFFGHILLITFGLHTLIHLKKAKLKQLFTVRNLILQGVFFITLISMAYTVFPIGAGVDITRQLVILLFPIFFSLSNLLLGKCRDNLLLIFSFACTATITGLYIRAFYIIHYYHLPVRAILSDLFVNHKFSNPINMHATFLSLQVAIALFYIIYCLLTNRATKHKALYIMAAVILFAGIVQLGSKAILAAMLVGINVAIPWFLIPKGKKLKYALITGGISILVIGVALDISTFKERFVTDLRSDLSDPMADESVEPRLVRWQAAMELVQRRPVIGYGAGSELHILGDKYFDKKLYIAYLNHLNAHDQYLTFLLMTGIVGLLIYLFTLFWGTRIALQRGDLLFGIFMLLIITVSLSESLLNAEKGVYFYALFFSFFIYSGYEKQAIE